MALPLLSILRSLAPLILDAGRVAVSLRANGTAKTDDRVVRLEQETIRTGEVLKGVAEQLQAVVEELRLQAEATEVLRQKARTMLILSASGLGLAVVALLVALLR